MFFYLFNYNKHIILSIIMYRITNIPIYKITEIQYLIDNLTHTIIFKTLTIKKYTLRISLKFWKIISYLKSSFNINFFHKNGPHYLIARQKFEKLVNYCTLIRKHFLLNLIKNPLKISLTLFSSCRATCSTRQVWTRL